MKTTPLLLFIPLLMTSGALAAGQDDFNVQTASSRMVKHEDGSRSYFEKTGDGKGMKKTTYNIRNVLVSVTLYKRGPFGELRSCLIFDGQKNELFFVRYGYDGNANLREEQMFDSRTKELVRRFLYTYDAMGNRSKPVCITLVKSTKDIETHAVPTAPEKDPFADDFKKKNKYAPVLRGYSDPPLKNGPRDIPGTGPRKHRRRPAPIRRSVFCSKKRQEQFSKSLPILHRGLPACSASGGPPRAAPARKADKWKK